MNFLSICSGIEAASAAFGPLGWKAVGFSEIEPFPCAVLAHHYPDVPNLGDMSRYLDWPQEVFAQADAIVGGPPCQAFSTAGLRAGLNDGRGNLTLTFARLINHADAVRLQYGKPPVVILYENVPGLLSDKTNAFGCLLAALVAEDAPLEPPGGKWRNAGLVFGPQRAVAWRILDAQYFGVAQRRRRVFVVASARAGFDPAAVLFEFDGVRRDSAPRREAGKDTSGSTGDGVARCLTTGEMKRQDWETCTMVAQPVAFDTTQVTSAANYSSPKPGDPCHSLAAGAEVQAVAFAENSRHEIRLEGGDGSRTGALSTGGGKPGQGTPMVAVAIRMAQTGSNGWGVNTEGTAYTLDSAQQAVAVTGGVFHTLRAEGFDASEDGTGRGTGAVAVGVAPAIAFPANLSGTQHASTKNLSPSMGAKNPTAVQTAMQVPPTHPARV